LPITNNAYKIEDSFYEEPHLQTTLDGFDELWQVTESSFPTGYKTPLEKLLDDQREEVFFLTDEVNILKKLNFELRQEMAEMQSKSQMYEKICEDYVGVIELNRALTKQLNTVMSQRHKEQSQIQAMRTLLGI
jgi:hypothetical protein